jgi:hypothetical protein
MPQRTESGAAQARKTRLLCPGVFRQRTRGLAQPPLLTVGQLRLGREIEQAAAGGNAE